eukprot:scaffold57267_cov71-Phaeocystis_antarctica.AAC.4
MRHAATRRLETPCWRNSIYLIYHPLTIASTRTCSCCTAAGPLPSSTSADVLCASSHARAIGSSHRSWPRMTCISCHSMRRKTESSVKLATLTSTHASASAGAVSVPVGRPIVA